MYVYGYNTKIRKFPDHTETVTYNYTYERRYDERISDDRMRYLCEIEDNGEKENKCLYRDDDVIVENPFTESKNVCEELESEKILEERKERSMVVSRNRTINTIYDLAACNQWSWFLTITFSPERVNRYDYTEVSKKLSKWLNNIKTADPYFRYIVVPELHKDGAYHFHGLCADSPALKMIDSGRVDRSENRIYNVGAYKWGLTTATRVVNNVACTKYITKYITKELVASVKGRKRFWASKGLNRPMEERIMLSNDRQADLVHELSEVGADRKDVRYSVGGLARMASYFREEN